MIKKGLLLFTVLFGFVGISFGYEVVGNGGQIEITPPDTAVIGNYVYVFNNNGNISTDNYGQYLNWYNRQNSNNYNYIYGWIDGKLYFVGLYNNSAQKQGFITKFSVCSEGEPTNASKCTNLSLNADEFYQLNSNITKLIVGNNNSSNLQSFYGNDPFRLCYFNSNDSQYYCVQNAIWTQGYVDTPLTGSLGFTNIDSLSNGIWSSTPFSPIVNPNIPITGGVDIDGYDYINVHTGNYISYWEDKGFNQDMCYVGTRDLVSNYEDRITYYQGTGYTIFDTYSKLFNYNSFSISQIGTFINYWLINYDTWFLGKNRYIDSSPYYNMIYNSPSNYYIDKGPNLTNIFSGNKAVYYFLASTIRDRNAYIDNGTIGEELATYCYYKLTRYSNVSNDGQNYNINDNHDSSYDSNVAVYVRNKLNGIGSGVSFSGANVINSQSWDGSVLDHFTGDTYTDFSSFFSTNFNKYKTFFSQYDISDLALGQLPSYIVGFMLLLIFFRFLSH